MTTAKQILHTKGSEVWWVSPDAKIFEALEIMADKQVGALLVMDRENVVGIISERDYARKVILAGRSSKETSVREIMTSKLIIVTPDENVENCMAIMTNKRIRHLPVMDGEKLIGVISIGDVVKSIISEQGLLIDHLTSYITGK
jgi:CBS domain-containing protein